MNKIRTVSTLDLSSLELEGEPVLAAADYNQDPHADFALVDGSGRAWRILGGPEHQLTLLDVEAPVALAPGAESLYAQDIDGDGLTNAVEAGLGSDPRVKDTDGDGKGDGKEEGRGFHRPFIPSGRALFHPKAAAADCLTPRNLVKIKLLSV